MSRRSSKSSIVRCGGFAGALLLSAGIAGPVSAQDSDADDDTETVWDRGCGDDSGTDRCDGAVQQKMRTLYGWESAEDLVKQKVQFRRFMMVDGYGRDVLGLTFERRPGASPRVVVQTPMAPDPEQSKLALAVAPLSASLSEGQWKKAISLTENFDQRLAREVQTKESQDKPITICLHSWVTVMEAGDPELSRQTDGTARSETEDACANGLAMTASFQLADLAFEALPECHGLQDKDFRNRIMLLNHCKQLGGDRVAAAGVVPLVDKLDEWERDPEAVKLEWLFDYDSRKDAERFAQALTGWNVYWGVPHATDHQHATLTGWMRREVSETENSVTSEHASMTLSLEGSDRSWSILSFAMSEKETITTTYDD